MSRNRLHHRIIEELDRLIEAAQVMIPMVSTAPVENTPTTQSGGNTSAIKPAIKEEQKDSDKDEKEGEEKDEEKNEENTTQTTPPPVPAQKTKEDVDKMSDAEVIINSLLNPDTKSQFDQSAQTQLRASLNNIALKTPDEKARKEIMDAIIAAAATK